MTVSQLKPNQVQRGLDFPEPLEVIVMLPSDALAAKPAISGVSTLSRTDIAPPSANCEYFLGEFAMSEGQGGGEPSGASSTTGTVARRVSASDSANQFYTPSSIVRLLTEVIEPRDYAIFQNHGYMGLYGGLGAQDIHARKGLKKGEQVLDHMGSTELAANLFRATQAEDKLRREKITGKDKANKAHREVGAKVRQTIKELGGTMPEDLPTVESIKKLESKARKALKKPKP